MVVVLDTRMIIIDEMSLAYLYSYSYYLKLFITIVE